MKTYSATTNKGVAKPSVPLRWGSTLQITTFRNILVLLGLFCFTSAVFFLYLYTFLGTLHSITAALIVSLPLALVPFSYFSMKKGETSAATYLLFLSIGLAYGGKELAFKGMLPYTLVGGLSAIFLVWNLLVPRRKKDFLASAGFFVLILLWINYSSGLLRYDSTQSRWLMIYVYTAALLPFVMLFFQMALFSQRRSIRMRMLSAVLLLVILPIAATTAIANNLFHQTARQQVIDQLESVASLKESEIVAWRNSLEPSLYLAGIQQDKDAQLALLSSLLSERSANPTEYQQARRYFIESFEQAVDMAGIFDEIFIMDLSGSVVLSTGDSLSGTNQFGRDYFNEGRMSTYVSPPFRSPETRELVMVVTIPYQDNAGQTVAILGGRVNLQKANSRMIERAGMGNTGETYLVSKRNILLTESRFPGYPAQQSIIHSQGITTAVSYNFDGTSLYNNYRGQPVIGVYRWVPDLQVALIAEQEQAEAFAPISSMLYTNVLAASAAAAAAILIGMLITQQITSPIRRLKETAERISAGELQLTAAVEQEDEIGALSRSFSAMTIQLRNLISGLEQRVTQRTLALERQSVQLQAAAKVARDATGLGNLNDLLSRTTKLICEHFGFYHAGIFLIDERGEYAVLRAATGDGGRQMLEIGHKLRVAEKGLVGFVTSSGKPRIALDVGVDAVHFKNPYLPLTRSEAALPLKIGDRIIGAVDVQSVEAAAFDEEIINILQTLTDQLAVAIENARLMDMMEHNVKELETAYGEYTASSWRSFIQKSSAWRGYRYRGFGAEPVLELSGESREALEKSKTVVELGEAAGENAALNKIAVPMRLRGQTVGVVNMKVRGSVEDDDLSLYEEIANRLSLSLENVRLLHESQLRSEQLRMLQDITAEAASHLELHSLLESVANKILQGFQLSRCSVFQVNASRNTASLVVDIAEAGLLQGYAATSFLVEGCPTFQEVLKSGTPRQEMHVGENVSMFVLHDHFKKYGTQTVIFMPIRSRGEVTAIFTLETADRLRRFNEDELRLAAQISQQIGTAVDMTHLFEKTRQRAERERQLADITARVRSSTNLDVIMKTAVQELAEALQIPRSSIVLREDVGSPPDE